jgi:superfamily II DNA or RNA helicase
MSAPVLRAYQEDGVNRIRGEFARGALRVLYTAPTGSGKTVLFSYVIANAVARGRSVGILGHRQEIVDQIDESLHRFEIPHGLIAAGRPATAGSVQVASVATLVRRLAKYPVPELLVIDEAHHAVAGTWLKIIAAAPAARILGVTATPERLDGKGLADVFQTLVLGPSTDDLIGTGFLSQFVAFAPPAGPDLHGVRTRAGDYALDQLGDVMAKPVVIGAAVDEYAKRCSGVPAIVFCVDIGHSELVAAAFRRRGFRAAHLDGATDPHERRAVIAGLASGEVQVVTNCGLISEGVDVPAVTAIVMLRPTKSLALYLQQCGRGLRPGKPKAFILDHAGNCHFHGLPDEPRAWSLEGREKTNKDRDTVRRCNQCGAINPLVAWVCVECGATLRLKPSYTDASGPGLIEIERIVGMSYGQALRWAGFDEARLRLVAKARGYKSGWVWHRLRELAEHVAPQ